MKLRRTLAALSLAVVVPAVATCGAAQSATPPSTTPSTTASSHPAHGPGTEDLGLEAETVIGSMVESWSPVVDTLREVAESTGEHAQAYRVVLGEALTIVVDPARPAVRERSP